MSRLDSFVRRVTAQRDVLDHVSGLIAAVNGPVLELGLDNGRTYDHLRERLAGRRIIAFDRTLAAHPLSVPPDGDLILGEIRDSAQTFIGGDAALVHADIETNIPEIDLETALWLPVLAAGLLTPGGIVASGMALDHPALERHQLPEGVPPDRYFIYRRK